MIYRPTASRTWLNISTILEIFKVAGSEANIISATAAGQIGDAIVNTLDHFIRLVVNSTVELSDMSPTVDRSMGATIF